MLPMQSNYRMDDRANQRKGVGFACRIPSAESGYSKTVDLCVLVSFVNCKYFNSGIRMKPIPNCTMVTFHKIACFDIALVGYVHRPTH